MADIANSCDSALPSFDELKALAESDPQAFDRFKQQKCEQVIASASEEMQPRLRAQQSHIDRLVGHCRNPNHVNMVLMQELCKQFSKFQQALQGDHPHYHTSRLSPSSSSATSSSSGPTSESSVTHIDEWR
ncbi:DUF3135 domain-containing protein [Vibrio sinensis]|uniref:DUF3135 domain-containing protein n=1 Tax=Vibrio sinensis TaxID=2302434 RepID=A0A3A6QPE0_9VIBR|nr:DUF3135 domain-containing protein [Vibrio sinensis]RJX72466.1 DUF3135 domain-containing protein [Vibrio sinensis]